MNFIKYDLVKYLNFKYLSLVLFIVVIVLGILLLKKEVIIEYEEVFKCEQESLDTIYVDIKGAVNNPGVYELKENSRVLDLVLLSGGFLENSDTSVINLGKKLNDEEVVIIYTKEEIEEQKNGNTSIKIIETECICPKLENNDACINLEEANELVSINYANLEQLMTLPGIGESKALAIIEYRTNVGEFKTIEELLNVNGIGESTFNNIKGKISL